MNYQLTLESAGHRPRRDDSLTFQVVSPTAPGAGLGHLAGRAIPARRDRPAARLHRQPVPATLTTRPRARVSGTGRRSGADGSIVTGTPYGSRPRPGPRTAFRPVERGHDRWPPGQKETACGVVSLRRHCPDQVPGGRRSASELSPASQPFLPAPGLPGAPFGPAPSITSQTIFTLHRADDRRLGPKARPARAKRRVSPKPAASRDGGVHASRPGLPDHSLAAAAGGPVENRPSTGRRPPAGGPGPPGPGRGKMIRTRQGQAPAEAGRGIR